MQRKQVYSHSTMSVETGTQVIVGQSLKYQ